MRPRSPITLEALTAKQLAAFKAKIPQGNPDECWEWQGHRSIYGYGVWIAWLGKRRIPWMAHRVAMAFDGRPVPDDLIARHLCHNRACCNPAHLALGTHADNTADMIAAGREAKPRGWTGVRGQRHPASRYSDAQRQEAITLHFQQFMAKQDVASQIGCAPSTITVWLQRYSRSLAESAKRKQRRLWRDRDRRRP